MALAAAAGLYGLAAFGLRRLGPMIALGGRDRRRSFRAVGGAATWIKFGEPFYTYTKYFQYNFSWAVHHFDEGNTTAAQFYTEGQRARDHPRETQVDGWLSWPSTPR